MLWVHASDRLRYERSVRDIADQLRVFGRKDPKANIFRLLRNWLRDEENGLWLVILDNADDVGFLLEPGSAGTDNDGHGSALDREPALIDYLPVCDHGTVLITSRNRREALRLVDDNEIVPVAPMDRGDAVALLEKKLPHRYGHTELIELATCLEHMPLAMTQAAALVKQQTSTYSMRQILDELQQSDKSKIDLLDFDAGDRRRDRPAKDSTRRTWEVSFRHLRQTRPAACDLLSLMSFFDREAIPAFLLRNRRYLQHATVEGQHEEADGRCVDTPGAQSASGNTSGLTVIREFDSDMRTLQDYLFVLPTANSSVFAMHRLVQLAMWKWLEDQGQLEWWKELFIENLNAAFPPTHQNWEMCESLFPHARAVVGLRPSSSEGLLQWASVVHKAASFSIQKGLASVAESLANLALEVRSRELGRDSEQALQTMIVVGRAIVKAGKWQEAESVQERAMEATTRALGRDHIDTLTSMSHLAETYLDRGRWEEAEDLERRAMKARRIKLGADHYDTLASMENLSNIYRQQGRWNEAEELQEAVLETRKRVLWAEHPNTLSGMNNLAAIYRDQRRYKEAEKLLATVVEASKRVLGAEHPNTLSGIQNLATIYRDQRRYKEAEELLATVVEASKRVLGAEHPNTLLGIQNLAAIYRDQRRYKEAEELLATVVEASKRVLGAENPGTLMSINNLAVTYSHQGRYKEAEELQKTVVEALKRVLGAEHPDTLKRVSFLERIQSMSSTP